MTSETGLQRSGVGPNYKSASKRGEEGDRREGCTIKER